MTCTKNLSTVAVLLLLSLVEATYAQPQANEKLTLFCTDPPKNMVGWWPLDETEGPTALDIIGGNHGEYKGGPTPVTGVVDSGLSFDGVDDFLEIPDNPLLDFGTGDFSIDFWIQTADVKPTTRTVLDKRRVAAQPRGYHLFTRSGVLGLQLADGGFTNYSSGRFIADGEPHHVAVTVDRDLTDGIQFYVDGVVVATRDPTPRNASLNNSSPLRLAARSNSTSFWSGVLDEVEIFNRVLSPFEVASIAIAGRDGKCKCARPGCAAVAWWPFDSRPGGSADDIAGHFTGPHYGRIVGATLSTGRVGGGLRFDGVDDRVVVASRAGLDIDLGKSGAFSVDAWIRTVESDTVVLSKAFIGCCHDLTLGYWLSLSGGAPGFTIGSTTDGTDFYYAGGTCSSAACPDLADGRWHHVGATVTYDAGGKNVAVRLYADGRLVDSLPRVDLQGNTFGGTFMIGALTAIFGPPIYFAGEIDEVEVFDRALVEADFEAIFGAGGEGKCREDAEMQTCGTRGAQPCGVGKFCDFPLAAQCGSFDAPGVCRAVPRVCTFEEAPVCGCDGNTYSNECAANAAGVSVASLGPC